MGVVGRAATVAGAVKGTTGRHPLGKRLAAVLPMLRDTLTGRWAGAPRGKVLAGMAGIVYVLSPLDILPEILLGPFGMGDDLAIAALSVAALLTSAEDWLDSKDAAGSSAPGSSSAGQAPGQPSGQASSRPTSPSAQGDVIVGEVINRS